MSMNDKEDKINCSMRTSWRTVIHTVDLKVEKQVKDLETTEA